jgi:hypothetical protein
MVQLDLRGADAILFGPDCAYPYPSHAVFKTIRDM